MQIPKKTILLVEDEAIIALTEKMSLEKYGYTVVLAGNGKKAVEAVETCPEIDLILMDINLGDGMDGTEAAELILREFDIPILFVSSHSEREIVEKTEKITSYGYVLKNSSITVLDASIKMAFKLFEANYKVERSEEYFRHSFEYASLGVCYVSMDGKFQRANKALQSMLGYSEDEIIHLQFNDITYPEDAPIGQGVMAQLIGGKISTSTFEKRYIRKNGTIFWATVSTSLVKSKGLPDHFITQIIDISERKLADLALQDKNEEYAVVNEELRSTTEELQLQNEALNAKELKLRESERRLTQAEKVARIGYWVLSLDTMIMLASDGADEIYGVDFRKSSLAEVQKIPMPEYRPALNKALSDLIAGIAPYDLEFRIKRQNDGLIIDIHSVATYDNIANVVFGVIQDVTERKRTEEALRQSEQRYKGFLTSLDAGVVVHAPDTSIILSNSKASELLGLSEQQMKGKQALDPAWIFVDADSNPLPLAEYPVNKILSDKEPLKNFLLGIRQSAHSSLVWVIVNGFPVMAGQGQIKEILISFIDVTNRVKGEDSLRESELKYRSLIESSSDAIFCVDQKGEYKFTNHLFASTFGKNPDYFLGKTFWDVYPKEHADYRYEATKRVFQSGESESLEVTVPLPDKTLYFYATANPIKDETGKVILSLTHAVDITERKLAEEKVKSLLAEKELVLKEVHHRIKNNMNTMMSLLSLQAGNARDGFAKAALLDAEKRMQSMGLLYDKLYQSVEFNKLPIEIYLSALVDEVIENFPNSNIVKVEKYFGDFILDANQLQPLGMIINELLTNCMKYAFSERSQGLISVSATKRDDRVIVTILDDGIGMPESISWEYSTGFGLQLVKELTKQLAGTIRIERGNGTSVILEFAG